MVAASRHSLSLSRGCWRSPAASQICKKSNLAASCETHRPADWPPRGGAEVPRSRGCASSTRTHQIPTFLKTRFLTADCWSTSRGAHGEDTTGTLSGRETATGTTSPTG